MRILIIDDEESIRESLSIYFREKGHEVVAIAQPTRCDGRENRMCHGREECADVLIIDQWMPGMTGIEYLSRRHDWGCRATGQRKALMSANLTDDLKAAALQLGCRVFEKPVRFEDLEAWLEEGR